MDWPSLLTQIKLRHEALLAIEDEIGSSYSDRAARNDSLFHILTEAIDGQVAQINAEKDAVIQECRDYITKTINMRKAMGERLSFDGAAAARVEIQKVDFFLLPLTVSSLFCKPFRNSNRRIVPLKLSTMNASLLSRVCSFTSLTNFNRVT